jgi:transcriptional regulator GlxA family with amidase domain
MNFGIIVFPDVEELDFVGPWEMLTMWSKLAGGARPLPDRRREARTGGLRQGPVRQPARVFCRLPAAGLPARAGRHGHAPRGRQPRMVRFLAAQAPGCKALLSVCTGAFVLHAAGLLSGKTATTHWGSLDRLRALGDVKVVEQRFVQDGNVWTSAGVSAGTDLMLAFIAHTAGEEAAAKVQLQAEYYPADTVYGSTASHERAPAYVRRPVKRAGNP